jgi:hypothetical protein
VSDERARHIEHLFPYKNRRQFTKDLDYLLAHFEAADPLEFLEAVRGGEAMKPRRFLLTFDDGLREVYDVVAPILQEKGVPAIFFLNPAFLDNKELFYRNKLSLIVDRLFSCSHTPAVIGRVREILGVVGEGDKGVLSSAILSINYTEKGLADRLGECLELSFDEFLVMERPYLSGGQVRELIARGFHFGGHSIDHPNYKLIPLEEQLRQTRQSCGFVKDHFGLSYSFFSFPHEDAPLKQVFFDRLLQEGSTAPDVLFGTQNQREESGNRVFHRFNAERPEYPIGGLINGVLLYNQQKRMMNRQRVVR